MATSPETALRVEAVVKVEKTEDETNSKKIMKKKKLF